MRTMVTRIRRRGPEQYVIYSAGRVVIITCNKLVALKYLQDA